MWLNISVKNLGPTNERRRDISPSEPGLVDLT